MTAYVVDTGIRITHTEFAGRASHGWDFVDNDANADDCDGHGTHVAGTVAGSTTYSVAKEAKVVAVRVLGCDGFGTIAAIVSGIKRSYTVRVDAAGTGGTPGTPFTTTVTCATSK